MINDKADINEVLFCYLDILGYKEMVDDFFENPNNEDNLGKKINTALNKFKRAVDKDGKSDFLERVDIEIVSDTIILKLLDYEKAKDIADFFIVVSEFCLSLLSDDIFVRGSVVLDKHYEEPININNEADNRIIISNALIKSYLLEKEKAIYPRIIVDESVLDQINELINDISIKKEMECFISYDMQDGYRILNIFYTMCKNKKEMERTRDHIFYLLSGVYGRVFEKYMYLHDFINYLCVFNNLQIINSNDNTRFKFTNIEFTKEL